MSPKRIRMLETREISPDGVGLKAFVKGEVYTCPGTMAPHAAEIALANGWGVEVIEEPRRSSHSAPWSPAPEETKVSGPEETKPARRGRRGEA